MTPVDPWWGDRPPPEDGETERVDVGPLELWLRGVDNELWVAHRERPEGHQPAERPPEDVEWSRGAFRDSAHGLRITPVFPSLPLVVKPEHSFTLLRKATARIYARVPAWVRVEAVERAKDGAALLMDLPTVTLSETWWGTFTDGELALWLPTTARRRVTPDLFEPHRIMCTLQMANHSTAELVVEKLVLRVEHLSIFEKNGELWAEEVKVNYHGEEESSEILMDDQPPAEARGAREISPPRAQTRSFRARTFARLKALSGLGG
jgi:hypothetical protein